MTIPRRNEKRKDNDQKELPEMPTGKQRLKIKDPVEPLWGMNTVLNIPTALKISPTFIMISPTELNTPTVLKISPHGTHDIPHGTECSPWY